MENVRLVSERESFNYIHEPYGNVQLKDVKLFSYTQQPCEYEKRQGIGPRTEYYIEGVIESSNWCGALLCGVPVGKRNDRYPVGKTEQFFYVSPQEFEQGECRKIAM